jgi:hypothetical protein
MVLVPINNHAFGLFNMHNSWTIFYLLIMQHYFNFYMDYNLYTQSIFFLFTMQTRLFFFFFFIFYLSHTYSYFIFISYFSFA